MRTLSVSSHGDQERERGPKDVSKTLAASAIVAMCAYHFDTKMNMKGHPGGSAGEASDS